MPEPYQGTRKHKLLPKSIAVKIPRLYATENTKAKDKKIWVKFFSPYSNYTWYVAEYDGEDTFFGYVDGGYGEWGYFTLSELARTNINGLPLVERDKYFTPKKFSSIK